MHAHLDHDSCMEVTILRGKTGKVRKFAEHVIAERGVRHGRVMVVPTEVLSKPHAGGGHETPHAHPHRHPGTRSRRSA
jgi:CopG family nickel-responsive transcriptional regulator